MMLQFLGQPLSTSVVRLTKNHRYTARFNAPVPCNLIPPQGVSAAMQALGSQMGAAQPWRDVNFSSVPAGIGCRVDVSAVWDAPNAVIDPEIAQLPGLGALPVELVRDDTTGEVLYDVTRQPRFGAPGPPPLPPPSGGPPPVTPGAPTPVPTNTPAAKSNVGKFVLGAAALGALAWLVMRKV
jgi:hypothetical protein